MGRPSLAEQRREEILEAFGRCVAKYGLEGSTLEKIAEEAGMRRSILRHFVGNRDELVEALANKVIREYQAMTRYELDRMKDSNRAKKLVDFLLPTKAIGSTDQLLVIEGLIGAADEYPKVRKLVFEYVDDLVQLLADQLQKLSVSAGRKKCWDVAYALVCLSFNHESLRPLAMPPKYLTSARKIAFELIERLEAK